MTRIVAALAVLAGVLARLRRARTPGSHACQCRAVEDVDLRHRTNDKENTVTDQPSYALLEDVPAHVTQVRGGRTTATRTNGRWINQNGQIVPLDASGPWTPTMEAWDRRGMLREPTR